MPWVAEKKEEEEKAAKKKGGPVQKASGQKQGSLSSFLKVKKPTAAEIEQEAKKKAEAKAAKEQEDGIDEKEELALLSKVVKTGNVEEFDWKYTDSLGGKPVATEVRDLQAILINPKWADHGFDPEMQEVIATSPPDETTKSQDSH